MENYLKNTVSMLAKKIGARASNNQKALRKAQEFIAGELRAFGYAVSLQPFVFGGYTHINVIAELRGGVRPYEILIVGAHYDTVPETPGADDNASGVAGMLGLAHSLAGSPLPRTVRFVAFGLEEPPAFQTSRMGSYQYAQSLAGAGDRILGMICLEMIGFFSDQPCSQSYPMPLLSQKYPDRGNFIAMAGNMASRAFTESIGSSFRKLSGLPLITLNAPPIAAGIDFSDHWSFYQFGYKALMVTDTAFYRNPHYHLGTDTPETLDYKRMTQVVDGLAAAIREWGREE
jgi:Zn-dependent M28 family amino/carboxypeptidase